LATHEWFFVGRPSPFCEIFFKKYRLKIDKFHHFSFLVWFQFLSKSIAGQHYFRIMYIKPAKIVYCKNVKQKKTKIEKKTARKFLRFLWFWAFDNEIDVRMRGS
jgi:hypothetical protein